MKRFQTLTMVSTWNFYVFPTKFRDNYMVFQAKQGILFFPSTYRSMLYLRCHYIQITLYSQQIPTKHNCLKSGIEAPDLKVWKYEIFSKLIKEIPDWRQLRCSGVFIIDFGHTWHLLLVFLLGMVEVWDSVLGHYTPGPFATLLGTHMTIWQSLTILTFGSGRLV